MAKKRQCRPPVGEYRGTATTASPYPDRVDKEEGMKNTTEDGKLSNQMAAKPGDPDTVVVCRYGNTGGKFRLHLSWDDNLTVSDVTPGAEELAMEMLSGEDREAAIYSMQAVRRQVQRAGDKDLPEVVIPWTPGFEGKGAKDAENPSIEKSSCRERVTPSEGTPARPEDGHMPHEFPHQRPRRNEQPLPTGEWLTIANDGDFAVQMMVASKHDPVGFKSVVRLDAVDTDAPLSREAFLEKYPIHPSWASAPWASPKTRAMCARWTERYHAHEDGVADPLPGRAEHDPGAGARELADAPLPRNPA